MKRIMFILLLIAALTLPVLGQGATRWNIYGKPTADWFSAGSPRDTGWQWAMAIDSLVAGQGELGTGTNWYVDSGVTNAGDGSNWANALETVDEAINASSADGGADRGDIIHVAQAHAGAFIAANGFDADVAGISIIGYGNGDNRPTFTMTTDGSVTIGDSGVLLYNMRFVAGGNAIVMAISVEAAADDCAIIGCEFPEGGLTNEFVRAIVVAAGADRLFVAGNIAYSMDATGATNWLDLDTGIQNGTRVVGNLVMGEYAEGIIHSDDIDLEQYIAFNVLKNATTGIHCIEFTAAATGICEHNRMFADDEDDVLDPGSMGCFENRVVTATDESGILVPHDNTDRAFLQALMGREIRAVAGQTEGIKVWWVDGGVTSGDGKSPSAAFGTLAEALTVCSNSVDDWILIQDYSGATATITVANSFVHLIGYGNAGMPYPRIQASDAGAAGLTLGDAADRIEIANLFFAANTTGSGIGFAGAAGSYDVWIHHCYFGRNGNAARDGIEVGQGVGGAAPYLVVEDCVFGGAGGTGITRSGIRITQNATCGIIRRNIFRKCAAEAVNLAGGVESVMVLDNTFQLPSDTEGYAVKASATTNYCLIMGNRASSHTGLLRTEVFHDDDTTSTNSWAGNTGGGLDTLVKQSERIVAARRGLMPGSSTLPVRIWYVDYNATTGNGFTPFTPFKTIQEAMTVASDTVDDYILVFDYSGGTANTITIANAFVHLIGWNPSNTMPYPRIMPSSAVAGITITAAGDRVEICNLVIGGGDQTMPAITFDAAAGAYGVWIHDNIIGRDATAPGNDGILVPSGSAAPYCKIENNIFHGSATAGLDQCGIQIDGNATRGQILNNLFMDIGTSTYPAIHLSGSCTEMMIEGNRIAGKDDTTQGWGITLSANALGCWVDGNSAGSSNVAADEEAYEDDAADEANFWGFNTTDISTEMPGDD